MKIIILVNSRDFKNTAGMNKVIFNAIPELQLQFEKVLIVSSHSILELITGFYKILLNNPFSFDYLIFNSLASIRKDYNKYWNFFFNLCTIFQIKKAIFWHEMPTYFKIFSENPKHLHESKKLLKKFSKPEILHLSVSENSSKIIDFFNTSVSKNVIYNCITKNENIQNITFDTFTITTVGSIQYIKGTDIWVEVAIKVCLSNPKVQFLWCGSVLEEELFIRCTNKIVENNLQDRIRFLGTIESAYFVLSASHLVYSSSRIDSFPLSIIEAMAYGRNIIYYESGGIEEAVDTLGYKIANFDVDQTVIAIQKIFKSYSQGNFILQNEKLIEKYQSHYTPKKFVQNLYSVLEKKAIR